jgi:hypothetical protein
MNPHNQDPFLSNSVSETVDATLRLIANLPAPEGLSDRVQAGLRVQQRRGRVLAWPSALTPASTWMRSAAAAAIVVVVVGGGWGVYSRVQPLQPARVIATPPHAATPGDFSNAGAMRKPQTLVGPVAPQAAAVVSPHTKASGKATTLPARDKKSAAVTGTADQH